MKRIILKWLGLEHIPDVSKKVDKLKTAHRLDWSEMSGYIVKHRKEIDALTKKVLDLERANENRRIETSEIIETLQNLDNNEVIINLHNRIKKLEEQS